jgi:hypothetical protein
VTVLAMLMTLPALAFAQSPWERAAANLEASFTGPLARSLALVAIVIGGLMFMFGEGGAKRQISGIVFGGGAASRRPRRRRPRWPGRCAAPPTRRPRPGGPREGAPG